MKTKEHLKNSPREQIKSTEEQQEEGYPLYPPDEDIYNKFLEEKEVDMEEISNAREFPDNPISLKTDESAAGLDIPGAELDDPEELIGNEDEENNYYSLGGDNHNDLEEDKGD